MRTGESVMELALYTSLCCNEELIFEVGDVLSRCPCCQSLCSWELADPIISYEELESLPRPGDLWGEIYERGEDLS